MYLDVLIIVVMLFLISDWSLPYVFVSVQLFALLVSAVLFAFFCVVVPIVASFAAVYAK